MRQTHAHQTMGWGLKIKDGKGSRLVKGPFLCLVLLGMHVQIFGPSHSHSVGSVNRIRGCCDGTWTVVCSDQAHEEPRL